MIVVACGNLEVVPLVVNDVVRITDLANGGVLMVLEVVLFLCGEAAAAWPRCGADTHSYIQEQQAKLG